MDERLLAYYGRELQYLRELGGEFARQYPKIASRLGLDAFECADPYVERLLEGFAFLAARVQLKIDAEFPRFTESLLSVLYPHYLAPTPSMAVVHLRPNPRQGALTDGVRVPRGSALRANLGRGQQTACEYRTAHDVVLWPLELESVSHSTYLGDLGDLDVPGQRTVRAALRFKFRTFDGSPFQKLALERIPLFIRSGEQLGARLYELIFAGAVGLVVREPSGARRGIVFERPVRPVGFEDEEALLPYGVQSFQGYRLLHEYFALPSRFMFAELAGLGPGVRACTGSELEIAVLLDRHDPLVEASVAPQHFELFCTPAINLFPKKADRIHLSDRVNEYHVVPDRTRPIDFEVHAITQVVGFASGTEAQREFFPFYECTERAAHDDGTAYYLVHRQPRIASARKLATGPRSTYAGSEVFLSLVDGSEGPYRPDLKQLSVSTLCTNRDLPLHMSIGEGRTDFVLESGAPVESVRCVAGPSQPRPPLAFGATAWRLISHLSVNYLSLLDSPDGRGATALREMLTLYADLGSSTARREIDGVRSVASAPIVRRLPMPGPLTFARGLEITLECDERAFEGGSVFLLGAVLERFFAKHVSLNSFTETVLRTPQRGEIMRWPARIGRRPIA
ncbi:MAG: type VI secretion system baseplate subunit TssF [Pseudomonadota bacterium]